MEDIVICGAGGFARDVAHLIELINTNEKKWNLIGFIDENTELTSKLLNGFPVIGDELWFENRENPINVALGVGSPKIKEKIVNKLEKFGEKIKYPSLIHPNISISKTNNMGKGVIVCEGSVLTCNITIHDFVTINLNCTIGHDTIIEEYATISPSASISGNVHIHQSVYFGTGATIIEKLTVGRGTIVSAGAVVFKDLPMKCTAMGNPARPMVFHEE
ncbi:acetyltransferase [Paenibacillus qinlingensis]|uniref:Sugar O-acyltransferase (Sialic acid O-acetyltransferase NeuD family) n=1 Tax=Paenibacillus qinlingensis TaxID=1837343 RepID=A0ABU1P3F3_9BACL|nr:acetyltransferase [Paenibacillus qinlingensis]MDR6553597.1 sugar O-acyltransferase (sialic acid O-acetyltransferase NeuD family) [Paenibacillus qinlingensis]